jgi:hypothetical protein
MAMAGGIFGSAMTLKPTGAFSEAMNNGHNANFGKPGPATLPPEESPGGI